MTKQIGLALLLGLSLASPVITSFDIATLAIKAAEDRLLIPMEATY